MVDTVVKERAACLRARLVNGLDMMGYGYSILTWLCYPDLWRGATTGYVSRITLAYVLWRARRSLRRKKNTWDAFQSRCW
ncbi:hypothetical protein V8C86DRAFT_961165 [Haematococcus lacustris]